MFEVITPDSGLLTTKLLPPPLWDNTLALEGSTLDLNVDPASNKIQDIDMTLHCYNVTYESTAGQLVRIVTVAGACGASCQLLLDTGQVSLGGINIVALLLVLGHYEVFDLLIIFEIHGICISVIVTSPHSSTPSITYGIIQCLIQFSFRDLDSHLYF